MEQKRIEEITKYAEDGRSYGLTFKAEQILKECLAEMDRLQKERDAAVADIGRGVSVKRAHIGLLGYRHEHAPLEDAKACTGLKIGNGADWRIDVEKSSNTGKIWWITNQEMEELQAYRALGDLPTLETLLKANAEGRVLVLPCKVCEYLGEKLFLTRQEAALNKEKSNE